MERSKGQDPGSPGKCSGFEDLEGAEEQRGQASDSGSSPCLCAQSPTAGPSLQDSMGSILVKNKINHG